MASITIQDPPIQDPSGDSGDGIFHAIAIVDLGGSLPHMEHFTIDQNNILSGPGDNAGAMARAFLYLMEEHHISASEIKLSRLAQTYWNSLYDPEEHGHSGPIPFALFVLDYKLGLVNL